MNELAKALSDYKEEKDLSLRALAGELGVQHGTAESWMKGWRKPGYKHLPRIVELIEVDEQTIYRWLTSSPDYVRSLNNGAPLGGRRILDYGHLCPLSREPSTPLVRYINARGPTRGEDHGLVEFSSWGLWADAP